MEAQKGRADLIFPVVYTPERSSWLDYPASPITRFKMMIFARNDATFSFTGTPSDLYGLRIGKVAKGRMHPSFRALEESGKADIEVRNGIADLVTAAHHGRLDAFVGPQLITLWTANRIGIKTVVPFDEPIGVSDIYLAFSKQSGKRAEWERLRAGMNNLNYKKDMLLETLMN